MTNRDKGFVDAAKEWLGWRDRHDLLANVSRKAECERQEVAEAVRLAEEKLLSFLNTNNMQRAAVIGTNVVLVIRSNAVTSLPVCIEGD